MPRNEYPNTPLVTPMKFKRATLDAMKAFKRSKPWRGTMDERKAKFSALYDTLNVIYTDQLNGNQPVTLRFGEIDGSGSGASNYKPSTHTITLLGKLSVVTALHEFKHAMGGDEFQAVKWSVNLYRIIFPRLFARMESTGHVLTSPERVGRRNDILNDGRMCIREDNNDVDPTDPSGDIGRLLHGMMGGR